MPLFFPAFSGIVQTAFRVLGKPRATFHWEVIMAEFGAFGEYDAVGLAELVRNKDVSPEELLETAIARTERVNPQLNAVIAPMYDDARATIAKGLPDGPFRGVPFLLKDLHAGYKGVPLTNGSRLFEGYKSDADTEIVSRYRAAGLVTFGKTNTPEFGLNVMTEPAANGPTRNPWNTDHSPGGSSGGASSAVAARIVPIAHASDGGGSIRIPASCGGVFGIKPTRGRISMGPAVGEGWGGMSMQHAVSISVRDSAVLLDATAGYATGDPYVAPPPLRPFAEEVGANVRKLRIGVMTAAPTGVKVDPEVIEGVKNAAALCDSLGHAVEEAAPEYSADNLRNAAGVIIQASIAMALDERAVALGRPVAEDDVERVTWLIANNGRGASAPEYAAAMKTIHTESRHVARFFETYDVLLSPVLALPPARVGTINMNSDDVGTYVQELAAYSPFCQMCNATGQPSMSVPLHWTNAGLPVGIQFAGRYGDEAGLFRLAAQLEDAQPWAQKKPPVCADATAE
jgi:amidase/6-aminohexanoate-cyclic-dimer hydrolase